MNGVAPALVDTRRYSLNSSNQSPFSSIDTPTHQNDPRRYLATSETTLHRIEKANNPYSRQRNQNPLEIPSLSY